MRLTDISNETMERNRRTLTEALCIKRYRRENGFLDDNLAGVSWVDEGYALSFSNLYSNEKSWQEIYADLMTYANNVKGGIYEDGNNQRRSNGI